MHGIEWCRCHRRILTSGQQRDKLPCDLCQKEHAEGFKDRMQQAQKESEDDK